MSAQTALIGVDFTSHGDAALRWAHQHGSSFGWNLEAVHAWRYPWWAAGPFGSAEGEVRDEVISSARRHLQEFVKTHLPEGTETLSMTVVEDEPTVALLNEADATEAVAIVIGTTGKGVISGALTGAVGRRLAAASTTPVVIVPDDYRPEPGPIVVGVAGSANSVAALEWAIEHRREGQDVIAVTSWTANAVHLAAVVAADLDLMEVSARKQLSDTIDKAESDGIDCSDVDQRVLHGDARVVLRDLADEAEMLVVGTRGASGLEGLLLGSVASSLTHKPKCPLVLVPSN